MTFSSTVKLAQELIQRPSVTPKDAGCQKLIGKRLMNIGFHIETMNIENVCNLWARLGKNKPLVTFAGHTDVVPVGPLKKWKVMPFSGKIIKDVLYGRGAADMKGSIAAFITACERFILRYVDHQGSIGLLITSDEEGLAKFGTKIVVDKLTERNEKIDMCIVGEPTSNKKFGDTIKVGRRGSLNGTLTVIGTQRHIAYPKFGDNTIHRVLPVLNEIISIKWDNGNETFEPTSLQISNIQAGDGTTNTIPGEIKIWFNVRFSTEVTETQIKQGVEQVLFHHGIHDRIEWGLVNPSFETKPGKLLNTVAQSIQEITGQTVNLSTSGGTSDGRFIVPTGAQLVEFGPSNSTIHQVNEQIKIEELDQLSLCYERILEKLLLKNPTRYI